MHLTDQEAATRVADQQNELGALRAVLAASKAHLSAIANKRHALRQLTAAAQNDRAGATEAHHDAVMQATARVDRAEAYLFAAIDRAEAER
ncbi:hypothetical protein R1479_04597 [Ralstonia mannitolilytica]|uniref:hypothetical protein n=1 Tax=Ralstonia mannitolilytica TaxID=105219 RepID=UPI0028F512B2|nr:hypothetical protein [Ralstonia mannitolilytica]CAJ0901199.1 hypothetical protein R1479_04597 [Ralstonia mannitolilytica]